MAALGESGARLRDGVGQGQLSAPPPGRDGAQPGEEPLVTALWLSEDAASAIHRSPQHRGVGDVASEVGAMPMISYGGELRGRVPNQPKCAAELAQLQQRVEVGSPAWCTARSRHR